MIRWRFWKRDRSVPNHARLIAQPHATLDLVDHNGVVVAKVIMREIRRDHEGITVKFVDYFLWREGYWR